MPVPLQLGMPSMSSAAAWAVDTRQRRVKHLGAPAPGIYTITFPNRMINGVLAARVTVDRRRLSRQKSSGSCSAHLVFRYLDPERFYAFGIGGWGFNYSLFYTSPVMDAYRPWQVRGNVGDESRRSQQHEFDLMVKIAGSSLECFVNGTREFHATLPAHAHYQNGNVGLYPHMDSPVVFSKLELHLEPLTCFVVSPINATFDAQVYKRLKRKIERVSVAGHPIRCVRADQNRRSEPFIRTIIENMRTANVTVVLIPGTKSYQKRHLNENVFYELGVAHAMGIPTIIYAKNYLRMPADLRHLNIIDDDAKLVESVKELMCKEEYHPLYVA